MARKTQLTSLKQISDINLTPLMDLTFILLITFIITFPLIEQAIPVKLPQGEAQSVESEVARTVSVDEKGVVYLDNVPIELEQLVVSMGSIAEINPETTIMVRADERIQYGRLVKVLKVLHDAKITRMALVTEGDR